ncbi:hypothetical protein INT44_006544 [Umbelopsis vinacea]|uniref:Polysaccharide biosynthesis domain-containing protein n=1 Tax=Umbelopsis vinacea TaxID=44442 RepID=A0A8H7PTA3_9FUNG|nr:hypothetical protein INT44_006544 [Umbelopsis vinacea]
MPLPSADELEQLQDIEKQWAVKAMHHAETYFKLISAIDGSKLRLTGKLIYSVTSSIDDEIYADFTETFPEIDVQHLDEEHFKTDKAKAKWRDFINKYEKRVNEYNFGSLLRIDPRDDYTEQNTMFEIARNKKGMNAAVLKK